MNNFERHEAVEELLVKHTARELAGMVVDFGNKEKMIFEFLALDAEICKRIDEMTAKNEELKKFAIEELKL